MTPAAQGSARSAKDAKRDGLASEVMAERRAMESVLSVGAGQQDQTRWARFVIADGGLAVARGSSSVKTPILRAVPALRLRLRPGRRVRPQT
ncbi:hypothetical protein GCM10008174_35960 [Methylopila turkensis]|uniref:Uncharacterized protein n=1 Tax=Methylopila turkensis TaxID=1437816 RepID=A0A9W6JQD1_9HYPH|nr:hypothetical protein GCM10008174_35960 [Methylopila turkensis]